jgi:hypothetical protein
MTNHDSKDNYPAELVDLTAAFERKTLLMSSLEAFTNR